MIVILGAGIAGLAAAARLAAGGEPFLLLEREGEAGGLCRSYREGPFSFDYSGHFLHTSGASHPLLDPLLSPRRMGRTNRDARVWSRGVSTPFPFQANLHGRPEGAVRRMVRGYARALEGLAFGDGAPPGSYREWLASRFGDAMCRAFFYPYNRKMWRLPLEEMVPSWADWSIPLPSFEEVLSGATGRRVEGFGYNATFLYPRRGGIGSLPGRMAAPLDGAVRTGFAASRLDLSAREVTDGEGRTVRYDRLVSTVPLPDLCRMARGLPRPLREAGERLRWTRILTVNWGVRGEASSVGHWTYVPDRAVPYFRVGCLSAVDRGAAPDGHASLFTDQAFPGTGPVDAAREAARCRAALVRQGVIRRESDAVVASPVLLDPGYVVFDRHRAPAVARLARHFRGRGVHLAGRYGTWDYFGMERSILSGIAAADDALGR